MIKITIEAETLNDIKQIIDAFHNTDHDSGRKHYILDNQGVKICPTVSPEKRYVWEHGAGEPVLTGTPTTNSITAPDMPNVTISGSSAPKKEIPLETVKKYIGMAGTVTGTFSNPEKKEVK